MARLKVLAIAVATCRIGYVFMEGDSLKEFKFSRKASKSTKEAKRYVSQLISYLKPDVVVTEKVSDHSRKGKTAKRLIAAITKLAGEYELLDVSVPRVQMHKNKYDESRALAKRFPELKPRLPRIPRIWQSEPFGTIYFEALSLALQIVDGKKAT